jgi:hypothetical protein
MLCHGSKEQKFCEIHPFASIKVSKSREWAHLVPILFWSVGICIHKIVIINKLFQYSLFSEKPV